jgi:predicted nucleic acid-binding protein
MSARVFVDTNVLVYARDRTEEEKNRMALAWLSALWEARAGRLSWQILQEYYVTVTRKLDFPRDLALAREDVASLVTWRPESIGIWTIDAAWSLEDRFQLSWWDALIVAAARAAECTHLLSEDLQDGQVLDGVTIISPFTHAPANILGV